MYIIANSVLSSLYFLQSGYTYALTNTVYKDKGFFKVFNGKNLISNYQIGNVIGVIPVLSGLNHMYSAIRNNQYSTFINQGANPIRWIEYSFSASLMTYVLSQLAGIEDIKLLITLTTSMGMLQSFGYYSEKTSGMLSKIFNGLGFVLFIIIWIPILISFFTEVSESTEDVPIIVYLIIFVLLFLFLLFGLANTVYLRGKLYKKTNYKKFMVYDFKKMELIYLILSFVSKTFLINMFLFGSVSMN